MIIRKQIFVPRGSNTNTLFRFVVVVIIIDIVSIKTTLLLIIDIVINGNDDSSSFLSAYRYEMVATTKFDERFRRAQSWTCGCN